MPRRWSRSEDETLRQKWRDRVRLGEIASALGRTPHAVVGRRYRMGLKPRDCLAWTELADARLKTLWLAGAPSSAIASDLKISRGAVMGRVWRLGLTRKSRAHRPYDPAERYREHAA